MSLQDYTFLLAPGESEHVGVGEADYIFVKQADRPVNFVLDQGTVELSAGGEYESRTGLFSSFEVVNTDKERPIKVVVAIGTERYRTTIITGEVVVDPRVKTVAGEYVADTRADHNVLLALDYKREPVITAGAGTQVAAFDQNDYPEGPRPIRGLTVNETTFNVFYNGTNEYAITIDRVSGEFIRTEQVPKSGILPNCGVNVGGSQWVIGEVNGKYTYLWTEGDTDPITSADRFSSLACEGAFWFNLFFGPNGDVWGMDTDYKIYNITQGYKAFTTGNGNSRGGAAIGNDVYIFDNQENLSLWRQNAAGVWEFIEEISGTGFSFRDLGGVQFDENLGLFVAIDDDLGTTYDVIQIEPETYGAGEIHYGTATETCTRLPGIQNRALDSLPRTSAAVTVEWENGQAFVSGEVIKAMLELLGIDVSGDYLDGITGIVMEARNQVYNLNLGGRTFAAEKIADDWTAVKLPQVIKITALSSLWSNRK